MSTVKEEQEIIVIKGSMDVMLHIECCSGPDIHCQCNGGLIEEGYRGVDWVVVGTGEVPEVVLMLEELQQLREKVSAFEKRNTYPTVGGW